VATFVGHGQNGTRAVIIHFYGATLEVLAGCIDPVSLTGGLVIAERGRAELERAVIGLDAADACIGADSI